MRAAPVGGKWGECVPILSIRRTAGPHKLLSRNHRKAQHFTGDSCSAAETKTPINVLFIGKSPKGLPGNFAGLGEDQARRLQAVAWQMARK
ncbi:MAG: hypothetical protein JSS27_05410 [Planctomycetes bacterium]|nr:hypothetical protein [Planctomycetota bacterium]